MPATCGRKNAGETSVAARIRVRSAGTASASAVRVGLGPGQRCSTARPLLQVTTIPDALKALPAGPAVFEIGDCFMPRTAFEAMQEATALAHRL